MRSPACTSSALATSTAPPPLPKDRPDGLPRPLQSSPELGRRGRPGAALLPLRSLQRGMGQAVAVATSTQTSPGALSGRQGRTCRWLSSRGRSAAAAAWRSSTRHDNSLACSAVDANKCAPCTLNAASALFCTPRRFLMCGDNPPIRAAIWPDFVIGIAPRRLALSQPRRAAPPPSAEPLDTETPSLARSRGARASPSRHAC